jgi:hypothetical protein
MSKKGEDILKKHLDKKDTIPAKAIFGDIPVINHEDLDKEEFETFKKEKEEFGKTKKEPVAVSDLDLNDYYKNKISDKKETDDSGFKTEPEKVEEPNKDLYSKLFGNVKIEEVSGNENKKDEIKEEIVKKDFTEKEAEEIIEHSKEMDAIKEVCESDSYPPAFPDFKGVLKLKKEHKDILFIFTGSEYEQFYFNVIPELFICTTFKSENYFEFIHNGGDERDISTFFPFVISKAVLFPKIEQEDVFEMPAGTVKQIVENILMNSKFKTSIEVLKI